MQQIMESKRGRSYTLDSREVAEMVGKRHDNLLRDITGYINNLSNVLKIEVVDFFLENQYLDKKGENRVSYLITRKGCEFIANKLTGKKGSIFTATYINRFHEMENRENKNVIYYRPELYEQIIAIQNNQEKIINEITALKTEINHLFPSPTLHYSDPPDYNLNLYEQREWKNLQYQKMKDFICISGVDKTQKEILNQVYMVMSVKNDLNKHIKNHKKKYNVTNISTIDVVAENMDLRRSFETIINALLNWKIDKQKQYLLSDDISTQNNNDISKDVNFEDNNLLTQVKNFTEITKLSTKELIETLGKLKKDPTISFNKTYRQVYQKVKRVNWNNRIKKYRQSHDASGAITKIQIVENSKALNTRVRKIVINEIIAITG